MFANVAEKKTKMSFAVRYVYVVLMLERKLVDTVMASLKPVVCSQCNERFANTLSLSSHLRSCHVVEARRVSVNPTSMTVEQLKEALRNRQLSTTSNKDVLVGCLEGALANEC